MNAYCLLFVYQLALQNANFSLPSTLKKHYESIDLLLSLDMEIGELESILNLNYPNRFLLLQVCKSSYLYSSNHSLRFS